MASRERRRARHRKHKARSKAAVWRSMSWVRRGIEFLAMEMFVDADDGRVLLLDGPMAGQLVAVDRGRAWLEVAHFEAVDRRANRHIPRGCHG